jgi:hypothetical protein
MQANLDTERSKFSQLYDNLVEKNQNLLDLEQKYSDQVNENETLELNKQRFIEEFEKL